jgi:hypothetical protein
MSLGMEPRGGPAWARIASVVFVVGLAQAALGCDAIVGIQSGTLVAGDGGASDGSPGDGAARDTGNAMDSTSASDSGVPDSTTAADSSAIDSTVTDTGSALDSTVSDSATQQDSGPPADVGPLCMGGSACTPAACQYGVTACDGGAGEPFCSKLGVLPSGSTCADGGGVCDDAGSCSACASGQDCSQAGSCARMTISCVTGSPVCTANGNQPDGTMCGVNLYCHSGACTSCVQSEPCTPPSNPCGLGGLNCTTDTCVQNGLQPPGTQCGANLVCNSAGACVPCSAMLTCTPANPCDQGLTNCSSGASVCMDTGAANSGMNGMACSAVPNGVCNNGTCNSCAAGSSCTPANVCDKGQITCGTGVAVCTDTGMANPGANGTSCNASNGVCDNGACNACANGMSCTLTAPANVCDKGAIACSSGAPVCTDTLMANPAANGASCGAGEECYNGACISCPMAGQACTPTNLCHTGTYSCATGSSVCTDTGNSVADGTACAPSPLACYHGVCQCNFPNLVAYYTFENNTNDLSGNNYNAVGSGVAYEGGFFGSGIHPTGTTSTITIPTGSGYTFSGARTFCGWVNASPLSANLGQPFVVGGVAGAGDFYGFESVSTSNMCSISPSRFYIDNWGSGCPPNNNNEVVPGSWTYACFGYDGSNVTLFYSSSYFSITTPGVTTFLQTQYSWALSTVTIGTNTIGGTSTQPSNGGVLDEMSFWGRQLSMAEMNALYNSGAGCHVH